MVRRLGRRCGPPAWCSSRACCSPATPTPTWTTRLGARRQALLHVGAARRLARLSCRSSPRAAGSRRATRSRSCASCCCSARPSACRTSCCRPPRRCCRPGTGGASGSAVPYRLFALSNFASLLALLGFPLLFEPAFDLTALGWAWSFLFAGFALLCARHGVACRRQRLVAGRIRRARAERSVPVKHPAAVAGALGDGLGDAARGHQPHHAEHRRACRSCGCCRSRCTSSASSSPSTIRAGTCGRCSSRALGGAAAGDGLVRAVARPAGRGAALPRRPVRRLHGLPRRAGAAASPTRAHLTRFYLMISLGGAARRGAGGDRRAARAAGLLRARHRAGAARAAVFAVRLKGVVVWARRAGGRGHRGPRRCAARSDYTEGVRVMERDFYGVVRTVDHREPGALPLDVPRRHHARRPAARRLVPQHAGRLLQPGLGLRPRLHARCARCSRRSRCSVGVIGLGAGVIAAWMQPGRHAGVLRDQPARGRHRQARVHLPAGHRGAKPSSCMGDGRLSLEREAPRGYDVLGIDAFSGDSIPMHLVTREAMAHLRQAHQARRRDRVPGHQPLHRPAAGGEAPRRRVRHARRSTSPTRPTAEDGPEYWYSSTDQVIVTRNRKLLDWPRWPRTRRADRAAPDLPVFTDSHHNLLRILK